MSSAHPREARGHADNRLLKSIGAQIMPLHVLDFGHEATGFGVFHAGLQSRFVLIFPHYAPIGHFGDGSIACYKSMSCFLYTEFRGRRWS